MIGTSCNVASDGWACEKAGESGLDDIRNGSLIMGSNACTLCRCRWIGADGTNQ